MKRVVVVEDNSDNRLLVQAILEPHYEVIEYESGAAALSGVPDDRPDLILLDISLPGMDGLEVLQRIRDQPALGRIPVIALTAHAMEADRKRFLDAGFDEYVSKPITDEHELLGKIRHLLESA